MIEDERKGFDEWALDLCDLVASRSRDPGRKCGAAIFRPNGTLVSIGYNGYPRNTDDDPEIYLDRPRKLLRTIHAELNALLTAKEPLDGYTMYVVPFHSCSNCAACIIQKGITRVVILDKEEGGNRWKASFEEAAKLFEEAGVQVDIINMKDKPMDTNLYMSTIVPKLRWQVSSGAEYMWDCYGDDCRIMDFGEHDDNFHVSIIFNLKTSRVLEMTGYGSIFTLALTTDNLPWRWIDPEYRTLYEGECRTRNIDPTRAWDDIRYNDIDQDETLRRLDIINVG